MSFTFNWNAFAKQEAFQTQIHELLTSALNKKKPRILEDKIKVLNLDWGNEPPTLEMLEIGDVALDRFRGVFKLNYTGGATITVATKVQANPLNVYSNGTPAAFARPDFVQAPVSFPIPLHLTLRNIRLQGTVIVVFSKTGGLTLVFRNDPLQSIEVSSTFDKFASLATFLQQQIETQIRGLFREEVPTLLYQLSLKYLPSQNQAFLGQSHKSRDNNNADPIGFAEIDSEKPVSLVNILHISAMLSSRRTLALETPIMPTAIVRSEIHHRKLLTKLQNQTLSFDAEYHSAYDQSTYDHVYAAIKQLNIRSSFQRRPKRRAIKLRKRGEVTESEITNLGCEPGTSTDTSKSITSPDISHDSIPTETSEPLNTTRKISDELLCEPETVCQVVNARGSPKKIPLSLSRGIPVRPFVRDTKSLPTFSIRGPQHFVLPQKMLPTEIWSIPIHEQVDDSPPAYVA